MNTSTRRLLSGLATTAVILLGQGSLAIAAEPTPIPAPPSGPTGNEMLSVQPSLISVTAKPGATTTTQLTLRAAAPLSVTIKSQGLAQGTDGSFISVPADRDAASYSGRSMISATPESLSVEAGDQIKVDVNITVPADVGEGTRYGIITITGMPVSPGSSSNVGFGVELGVSAIVQIDGTQQVKTGEIKDISVGEALPGQPVPVTVSFQNTGNTHFGAVPNELVTTSTLQDASGTVLATADASGNQLSVVPPFSRDTVLDLTPEKALVDGETYHLEVGTGLKDGTVFDRKALDFTWSGGQVLSETGAPVQAPAVSAPVQPSTDMYVIIIAALVGALVVALLFLVAPRLLRRQSPGGGASDS
jgi:hypothetical protein